MTDIRVENATREYILELMKKKIERLEAENDQLRAELASIKPDWDTAPEWATTLIAIWTWNAGDHTPMPAKINRSSIYIEAKP